MSPKRIVRPDLSRPGSSRIEWRAQVPATLEAIDRFCRAFQHWSADTCANLDSFSTELVLREALTNSVIHGCAENRRKRVSCVLRVKPGRLIIVIRDAGKGFDWRSAWNRRSSVADTHGRGSKFSSDTPVPFALIRRAIQ